MGFKNYSAYPFRSRDPIMSAVERVAKNKYGDNVAGMKKDIERKGGASASCLSGWWGGKRGPGKTRRPQNATVEATLRAMGFQRVIRKIKKDGDDG